MLLAIIVPFIFSFASFADEIKVNPSHPDQYTVVKGDTLWGISAKFLQNPWQWKEVWDSNPQIKNPNRIYPGDTIFFTIENGKPRLSLTKDEKIAPHIRETPLEEAIAVIPMNVIAPFLTSPRVVTGGELGRSPYVVDIVGEHLVAGAGDRIYVRSITKPKSLEYTIFRQGEAYRNPDTREILGYEAQYIAQSSLQKTGDPATLLITSSDQEIRIGDRLLSSGEGQVDLNFFPRPPETDIKGSIISVHNGVYEIGQYDIIVIDKGESDGLESGNVLDIYQYREDIVDPYGFNKFEKVRLPPEYAGTIMIFRPFKKVSYALVMNAVNSIHVLDKVQTP